MIGFYNYTVILTFLSLVSSVFGMAQAVDGHFKVAIFCLAFSGLCDAFDGKVARTKKNRTSDECLFGIQLDSLCDVVAFGAYPAVICYLLGVRNTFGFLAIAYYCICSVIRLAFFNMLETNRMNEEDPGEKIYHGLPITSISIILPLIFLISLAFDFPEKVLPYILIAMLFVVGTLFILDFKMKKPGTVTIIIFTVIVALALVAILLFSKYNIKLFGSENIFKDLLEAFK